MVHNLSAFSSKGANLLLKIHVYFPRFSVEKIIRTVLNLAALYSHGFLL